MKRAAEEFVAFMEGKNFVVRHIRGSRFEIANQPNVDWGQRAELRPGEQDLTQWAVESVALVKFARRGADEWTAVRIEMPGKSGRFVMTLGFGQDIGLRLGRTETDGQAQALRFVEACEALGVEVKR